MKFFVANEVYKERMSICKSCEHYLSLLGNCGICKCFMKVKSRIAPMECPKGKWLKTTEVKEPKEIPQDIIEEVLDLFPKIKNGRAKTQEDKRKLITLYNTIYNTNYNTNTSCGSCLSTCFDGIKKLYKKNKKND
jgi:signal transduction histidine kinase|tara:strand:- start:3810 stop:4214 length:405 start_codon:yes stop_codon:yes gene_type:complete